MKQALFLAVRSLWWHRGRAATIIVSLAVTLCLPITVRLLLNEFRREITARADSTPLVIGARGSRLDLALHALYFETRPPSAASMAEVTQISNDGLGLPIPLHVHFRTQSRPGADGAMIVGTTPEYFEFRRLRLAAGQPISLLGDCVAGAAAAQRLGVSPGDSLMSAPENALDLAGSYPLKMKVTGVLAPSGSADDNAVFTDVHTVWVMEGIGHGHQEVTPSTDPALLLKGGDEEPRKDNSAEVASPLTVNAGVLPYTEITAENADSFHFHGDPESFPLTAILVVPPDDKTRTRILGRYLSEQSLVQCLKPKDVVTELLGLVFRLEQFAWVCSLAAFVVTLLLLSLVLNLSMKLRAAEMQTMFRLGCSQGTITMLYAAEVMLLLAGAVLIAGMAAAGLVQVAGPVLRDLLF